MILIVSGGEPPLKENLKRLSRHAELVLAADIGAKYCLDAGVAPDVVIGDMDSLPLDLADRLGTGGMKVISYPRDKDETDTLLALDYAMARGASEIIILSGLGDRFDHSIANLHLLYRALKKGVRASILTSMHNIFLVDSEHYINGKKGKTVSFLPLTEKVEGIDLVGFKYDVRSATMEIGFPYGVSNVILEDSASVKVREGVLVAVLSVIEDS